MNNLLKDTVIDLSKVKKINTKDNDLKMIICYESASYENKTIELKLKLEEIYSNNKIIY